MQLVDEFQWHIFEHVSYRDENGQFWSAINSEEFNLYWIYINIYLTIDKI